MQISNLTNYLINKIHNLQLKMLKYYRATFSALLGKKVSFGDFKAKYG